ncbi:glycoside hydrolase 100 family protein [Thiohalomonas denitrificans]|uniref:beta-fructofuranosidase n=1 Tax=Thiohalomonas denitrificans TaxID=415747 RepID=A0A1G5PZG2_9GAMM|nr:glycoside hydrolase 100 family protein [Thiohalomonas denitrificans]SCZ54923.1 Alkaline and neutral invertase [Thiohalomonas denitrificans]
MATTSHATPIDAAYAILEASEMRYRGRVIGTVAARDPNAPAENYADCFVRDFVPSALVYLLDGRETIVRDFLQTVLELRHQQERWAGHEPAPGVMPASFKVVGDDQGERLIADFGDHAIGRVAPVDSMLWWMILLRAYVTVSDDADFAHQPDVQRGMRQILDLLLRDRLEVAPTLLVPDGSFMIDRRMGVYGHPLEVQALFFGALCGARQLLETTDGNEGLVRRVDQRLRTLRTYIRIYYWLDVPRLNEIHRYKTEQFGQESVNILNIHPESIPDWVPDWLPDDAGYLVGNLGPGRMDFRFFALGNLLSILFGLSTDEEAQRIMLLYEERWPDLIGTMPVKISYPAMEGEEWRLMTGSDPKNAPWSYHNGGNWPALLWTFVGAAVKVGRTDLAEKAYAQAAERLPADRWAEYYDGRHGRLVGRRSNHFQTWSATSLILGEKFLSESTQLRSLGLYSH